jgi:integrator complex subunit 11
MEDPGPASKTAEKIVQLIKTCLKGCHVQLTDESISVESVLVKVEGSEDEQKKVYVSWDNQDEEMGKYILGLLKTMGH